MSWLPGTDVTASQPDLIARLEARCTQPGYSSFDAMCLSRRVGKEFLRSAFFAAERLLVYYQRHDCPRLNRLHIVPAAELAAWLDDRIHPERGQGVDLTITGFEMSEFLITNHDGDLWVRRPSEWPPAKQIHAVREASPDCESSAE